MPALPAEDNVRLVEALGRQYFLARCSDFQPARYGIIHEKALRGEFASLPESAGVRRARLLRLLGENRSAASELADVLRRRDAPAEAHALHWESGAGGAAAIDRAAALEPANGAWRAWRAIELLSRAEHGPAAEEAAEAARLMPGK
ncbi:MAG: hypothetical protein NUW21_12450, partial [Elusimicrobia bacterium]|nr:hypothetical protein [Elusimicrobiota bacterium]